ncbi:MAG: methylated-DNA-[protein]-cysteine S-methyltransferase [Actinomycetota bacterium]|jgi:methylated-DNA-[protein]-cysteine S-methyltransferase|nr:methylated-DNA-[protein]-cysteine S-methyltransferase [Actinomycetota bacterium]MDQ1564111.1 methylated-DNA-[protein]-cysteine S-methyltransferase [Actinomycetota bacterium]
MSDFCQSGVGRCDYSRVMFSRSSTQTAPAHLKRVDSPLGRIEIASDGAAITSLSIERAGTLPFDELPENSSRLLDLAAKQLGEYFAGKRQNFELPVAFHGTTFQESIWSQLVDIPFGEVMSYGELGLASGRASAGRAVGGAVGANPVPIIVPCHRVLAGNRRITGYSGGNGIPTKVWLLEHEGIEHVA